MARTKRKPTQTAASAPRISTAAPPATEASSVGEVLTLAEAAAYLRVPEADVLRLASTQDLPGRRIGDQWRFLKAAVQSWLSTPPGKKGLLSQLGALKDDPQLEEMLAEIYRRRGRPETEDG